MKRLVVAALVLGWCGAVDRSKFRTCEQTRFCRVWRTNQMKDQARAAYSVEASSIAVEASGRLSMRLVADSVATPALAATVSAHAESGVVRLRIVEAEPDLPRWEPSDVLLTSDFPLQTGALSFTEEAKVTYALKEGAKVVVELNPFKLEYYWGSDETPLAVVNGRQLLHAETRATATLTNTAPKPDHEDEPTGPPDLELEAMPEQCGEGMAWNGEKCDEIVGYWEDGLARFADGSKEVKRTEITTTPNNKEDDQRDDVDEVADFSESFGGHTDPVKRGPTSVGVDVAFPTATAGAYGLAEHASRFRLKGTTAGQSYTEPYRFYNLDVFEYDLDVPMALYGAIPAAWGIQAATGRAVGAFWNNPSETFVDVDDPADRDAAAHAGSTTDDDSALSLHWLSESGVADLFLMTAKPGAPAVDALSKLPGLVGAQELPPLFALGYHQCRWNYKDEKDVAAVHGNFEALDIPYDVLWLDIEHTDGKRYFTWDESLFPDPKAMQANLSKVGRKMVTIVDPHIKRDSGYKVHAEAERLGHYIKDPTGSKDFDGWCWPGSSSYLDFTAPDVRAWWAERFLLSNYQGSTLDLFTWNDMNEPSVFNGPEVTMAKDCLSIAGVEHREWHNLYGMYFHRATAEGLILRGASPEARARSPTFDAARPFVLTRSFFAGSQRWGAVWTGDNAAKWDHLEIAAPMLLSLAVCGFSFAGADAGGFFGDPEPELMARWIAAASFTPFFRGHAHHDAKRREPWSFGEPWTSRMRAAVADRYSWLPYWYTTFAEARFTGRPVMRPLWAHYPGDPDLLSLDDQWLVGEDLLVKPAVKPGATSVDVYLPVGSAWYDTRDATKHPVRAGPGYWKKIPAGLDDPVPALQRAGSVVARKRRLRRSTQAMAADPYELIVALDTTYGNATGRVYIDDFSTFGFRDRAAFAWTVLTLENGVLTNDVFLGPRLPPAFDASVAARLGLPTADCAPDSQGSRDANTCLVSDEAVGMDNGPDSTLDALLQVPVERLVVLGLQEPPLAASLHLPDRTPRPLDFLWDSASKKLTVRKPDAPVGRPWTIHFDLDTKQK